MASVVTPPASISKCKQKILDIQNNYSIKLLYENNLKYRRVLAQQKKDSSIQNPYSKTDFNLYKNYQKLERKVKKYYEVQASKKPLKPITPKNPPKKVSKTVTPDIIQQVSTHLSSNVPTTVNTDNVATATRQFLDNSLTNNNNNNGKFIEFRIVCLSNFES